MNTFFFGYLSLKWRRLIRTLIIISYILYTYFNYTDFSVPSVYPAEPDCCETNFVGFAVYSIPPLVGVALVSWLLKPFIVKDKS